MGQKYLLKLWNGCVAQFHTTSQRFGRYRFTIVKIQIFCDMVYYSSQNHAKCPRNLECSTTIRNFAVAMRTNLNIGI